MRVLRLLLATSALATIAACSSGSSPDAPPAGQEVVVEVRPTTISVLPGGKVDFRSLVTGTADPSVNWEVVEPDGGTVTSTGTYFAPLKSGEYTVSASSRANPKARGGGKVKVSTTVVTISPAEVAVPAGGSVVFAATVVGATDTAVTWSVREPSGCGSVDASGVYKAPAAGATCHVIATSVASGSASAEAIVSVAAPVALEPPAPAPAPVVVAVTPSAGAVDACRSLTFTASVSGTTNGAVTWSVQEGSAGGTVTPAGVYTAPASAGTYHVVATSQAAPASSTAVAVTVAERILGVTISPANVTLARGATAQFTATVTSTCGSVASTQTVTAPN